MPQGTATKQVLHLTTVTSGAIVKRGHTSSTQLNETANRQQGVNPSNELDSGFSAGTTSVMDHAAWEAQVLSYSLKTDPIAASKRYLEGFSRTTLSFKALSGRVIWKGGRASRWHLWPTVADDCLCAASVRLAGSPCDLLVDICKAASAILELCCASFKL